MAIEQTYRDVLLSNYLREQLHLGNALNAASIRKQLIDLVAADLSKPRFKSSSFKVKDKESASATKFNFTFNTIHTDLKVVYQELAHLGTTTISSLERWELESQNLENRLIQLEDKISDLLLLTQNTEGYFSIVGDDFVSLEFVDTDNTTAEVNLDLAAVTLSDDTPGDLTRIFLNNITTDHVRFAVQQTEGFISNTQTPGTSLINPFIQTTKKWSTLVQVRIPVPTTAELIVQLHSEPIQVSKITMKLHDSVQSGPLTVIPLYSTDNVTYTQLPITTYIQEIRSAGSFFFPMISAKYFKFILTKQGPDSSSNGNFQYQFGFQSIAFFKEGFSTSDSQVVISKPLSVQDMNGTLVPFSKLALEVCERVEPNTTISYAVLASNDSAVPFDDNTKWIPISPTNREAGSTATILEVGDVTDFIVGSNSSSSDAPAIAYDGLTNLVPEPFFLVSEDINGEIVTDAVSGSSDRYYTQDDTSFILNYQLKDINYTGTGQDSIELNENSVEIFRNVGSQGLDPTEVTDQVRGIQKGWEFEEPFYKCVIEVRNPLGIDLGDAGHSPLYIDETARTGYIGSSILTGKSPTRTGIHYIKVHKDNWRNVTIGANSITELKSLDSLYPYNQKLLIEGYLYGDTFKESKVYVGAPLFAGIYMKQLSLFDFHNNASLTDYKFFTLDRDLPETHYEGNPAGTRVILVKSLVTNSDYQNERFMIRFKQLGEQRNYLRFKATLSTKNTTITPVLDGYKFKLG